jgi:hypothetical protein
VITLLHLIAMALLGVAGAAAGVQAAESAPSLAPGTTFTITFPEMPPTFYAVFQKTNVNAQMSVYLPTNYDPARKHPLIIFLGGGDGGILGSPGVARGILAGRDFICVGMPLFKVFNTNAGQPNVAVAGYIMQDVDGQYMWPYFKTMLERLEKLVPNLDPAHGVLGGFSNGAHATAALIDGSDGEIMRRFSAFLVVEGAGKLKHYELLKGKPYLMVSSHA